MRSCRAMNEIWPDGILDHKAKARNEHILRQLKIAKQHAVSPRTIQRTRTKNTFRLKLSRSVAFCRELAHKATINCGYLMHNCIA